MDALQYAKDLIAFDSVSRQSNASVSDYVERRLKEQGFDTERIEYDDHNGVRKVNVIAKKGKGTGGLAYFGHTDVVPADDWRFAEHGPFSADRQRQQVVRSGQLRHERLDCLHAVGR
ncbi:MAG: hypothetical protein KatS3mg105_4042 [Gemmatales bacterium]|nr:MAG: hypothetical protein KatS3mg105_4042 [Gemmatales bacterium]